MTSSSPLMRPTVPTVPTVQSHGDQCGTHPSPGPISNLAPQSRVAPHDEKDPLPHPPVYGIYQNDQTEMQWAARDPENLQYEDYDYNYHDRVTSLIGAFVYFVAGVVSLVIAITGGIILAHGGTFYNPVLTFLYATAIKISFPQHSALNTPSSSNQCNHDRGALDTMGTSVYTSNSALHMNTEPCNSIASSISVYRFPSMSTQQSATPVPSNDSPSFSPTASPVSLSVSVVNADPSPSSPNA